MGRTSHQSNGKSTGQSTRESNGKSSNGNATRRSRGVGDSGGRGGVRSDRRSILEEYSSLFKVKGFGYLALVGLLAVLVSVMHRNHISHLFESDRHFSHLSTLERELTFRTEMGLYYSYFKTVIEAPSFFDGLGLIMNDNVTEFPLVINTLKRFNLYPEVFLGAMYRIYTSVMTARGLPTKYCWQVNRGQGLSAVQSCEGLGEPPYFYIECVFLLNGIGLGVFFLLAVFLSGSILGGALAVLSFFYNHGECTRVQWTPPLRESFSYPFIILQTLAVTAAFRSSKPNYVYIAVTTVLCMLPWQFAQFVLLTQTLSVFAVYVLGYTSKSTVKIILIGQSIGLVVSTVLLFGNEMLLSSLFASSVVAFSVILSLESLVSRLRFRLLILFVDGVLMLSLTFAVKFCVSRLLNVADDAHIGDIFRSKFSDFRNFDTMLYTCAAEFDFMEKATPGRVSKTLLLPVVIVVLTSVLYRLLSGEWSAWRAEKSVNVSGVSVAQHSHDVRSSSNGRSISPTASKPMIDRDVSAVPRSNGHRVSSHSSKQNGHCKDNDVDHDSSVRTSSRREENADVLYHIFQLGAFTAMALIIMRLKLFWTPHMCLMTSLLASRKFFGWIGSKTRHRALIGVIMATMSVQGVANVMQQWSIRGEFSNIELEQLVDWINTNTRSDSVFAGPMPTMATVKLCTSRPIVNHPHYEDVGLRERTRLVYTMYSRKPEKEVWDNLRRLRVDYAILEDSWCTRAYKPGCSMPDIWDIEDEKNRGVEPVCQRLAQRQEPYFRRLFQNDKYQVLQVLSSSAPPGDEIKNKR